ncbi:NACHT domain-containing protein [Dactylosporangium sp. NPDC051541]|uniref:NACHT domain-containing protein n=1 Tax=Dactylosporangium sp. NPDC051541 TaxID=3363977 RepID=UPI0037886A73
MRRAGTLTYPGALRLLGHKDRRWIEVLDKVFGVAILAAGPAAYGGAKAAEFLWGAIDHKNEAVGLLGKLVDWSVELLVPARGQDRFELLEAAHTTIVGAALFEAWQQQLGAVWDELAVTDSEQVRLLTSTAEDDLELLLWTAEIPMPAAAGGLSETIRGGLLPYLHQAAVACQHFFAGLATGERHAWLSDPALARSVADAALGNYRRNYVRLATDVAEFRVWAILGGQAATFDLLGGFRQEVVAELKRQRETMAELHNLLALPGNTTALGLQSEALRRSNAAVLGRPPIQDDVLRYVDNLRIPTIDETYVTPHYHYAVYDGDSPIGDDEWWRRQTLHTDLPAFLAGHFGSPASVESPLLVLGDPGTGKSTFAKVLAARLPAERFLVVRVPLRSVTPEADVHIQVQEALHLQLPGRTQWSTLAEESRDLVRVVIFDGLDELIQSIGVGEQYLRRIREFQANEADLGSPVCTVVTSRTLVAGRTWVPRGCITVKIAEFEDEQIQRWLAGWRAANARAAAAHQVRLLDLDSARRLPELSRQPLLLLFIALYVADPGAPPLTDAARSPADLYRMLIENFIRREISRQCMKIAPDDLEREIADRWWRLGITALATFNRRQTYVLDAELAEDLTALVAGNPHDVVDRFFFIHTAKAAGHDRRSYEFLHATIGEYLVAATVLDRFLQDDDDLVAALLSYRVLPAQPRTLRFLQDLAAGLPPTVRVEAAAAGVRRLQAARQSGPAGMPAGYRPQRFDVVRARAAHTANLIAVLTCLDSAGLGDLAAGGEEPAAAWRALVRLWRAGLDEESWQAMVTQLEPVDGRVRIADRPWVYSELAAARFLGDEPWMRATEMIYHLGGIGDSAGDGELRRALLAILVDRTKRSRIASTLRFTADRLGAGDHGRLSASIRQLAIDFLGLAEPGWDYEHVRTIAAAVTSGLRRRSTGLILEKMDYRPLAITVTAFPGLTADLPGLDQVLHVNAWSESPHQAALRTLMRDAEWGARLAALYSQEGGA